MGEGEEGIKDVSDLCNWMNELQLTEIRERSRHGFLSGLGESRVQYGLRNALRFPKENDK